MDTIGKQLGSEFRVPPQSTGHRHKENNEKASIETKNDKNNPMLFNQTSLNYIYIYIYIYIYMLSTNLDKHTTLLRILKCRI